STGGGFKVARLLLLAKEAKKEFLLLVHPRNIRQVKMDGKTVDHNTMRSTSVFLVVYMAIFVISFILVSIDGKGFVTSFTSVAATLNNTGPGLGDVGPVGNYTFYSPFAKCVLSFDMLAGRLELYPLLLLFAPAAWKRS
ncbi:MAG: potassium transporter TrkG, partial [Ruminococcus sp.]|nr:potassium transporter TrkG [Ruminococcus sp.]